MYNEKNKNLPTKCPTCGEYILSPTGVCPSCGHVFNLSQTDVVLIEKLEQDCQALSNIKHSGWPILLAINIIAIGITILCDIKGIYMFEDDPFRTLGGRLIMLLPILNMCGWMIPVFANQDDKDTGELSAKKLKNTVFNIRSKINSTKLLYAHNPLIMERLGALEEYINENLRERKRRTRIILVIAIVVAVAIPVIGYFMEF